MKSNELYKKEEKDDTKAFKEYIIKKSIDPFWETLFIKEYENSNYKYDDFEAIYSQFKKNPQIFNELYSCLLKKKIDLDEYVNINGITALSIFEKNSELSIIEVYLIFLKEKFERDGFSEESIISDLYKDALYMSNINQYLEVSYYFEDLFSNKIIDDAKKFDIISDLWDCLENNGYFTEAKYKGIVGLPFTNSYKIFKKQ